MQTRTTWQTALLTRSFEPRDAASLAFFRIAFGLILIVEVWRYFQHGWIGGVYLTPPFHFTFVGFGWVRPLPAEAMYLLFLGIGCAAALVALGWRTRWASLFLTLSLTYIVLIEKAVYLNHLYLICTLAFLMVFVPSDRLWSVAAHQRSTPQPQVVPAIALWVMRTQLAIPYVYGALAKLNGDWLHGQPMQMWMSRMTHVREIAPAFGEHWLALVFSYGGFLLDLLVVPLLLWRRSRPWAFGAAIAFHLGNALFFRIGVFPWLMICATTLFLSPSWPRLVLRWFRLTKAPELQSVPQSVPDARSVRDTGSGSAGPHRSRWLALTAVWFGIQLILPFRHGLYPGRVDWTEEGTHFSWRMMLADKNAAMQLLIVDRETKTVSGQIDPRRYLTPVQINKMSYDPDMLIEFSHFLADEFRRTHQIDVEIRAQVFCSLNGRRPQLLVDPQADLARQPRTFRHQSCIVPLTEPLLTEPWSGPPETWFKNGELSDVLQRTLSDNNRAE